MGVLVSAALLALLHLSSTQSAWGDGSQKEVLCQFKNRDGTPNFEQYVQCCYKHPSETTTELHGEVVPARICTLRKGQGGLRLGPGS